MNRILEAMKELNPNDGYYSTDKLIPYFDDAMIFFIVGERRIGKTDYFLHLACKLYQDYNVQTMWIRNKLVELKDAAFASAFLNDAKLHEWCPAEWETRSDGVYTSSDKDADQVILFQSISTFSNRRGGANPRVLMMVLDEFMPEDRVYPKQACKGLLSLTKTVFSGNTECRVFCLSNIISAVNPYFAGLKIFPDGDITIYKDKGSCIEKCQNYRKAIAHDNPWNKLYRAGNYGDYADESEDDILTLVVKSIPSGAKKYDWKIIANSTIYSVYSKGMYVYFEEHKGNLPRVIELYTVDRDAISADVIYMPTDMLRNIKDIFDTSRGRFVGANCLFDIMSIIYNDL